jgi:hypothetical protein
LTLLISEWYGFVPKAIAGRKDAKVNGIAEGYVGNKKLSLEKILKDLKEGKDHLRSEIAMRARIMPYQQFFKKIYDLRAA